MASAVMLSIILVSVVFLSVVMLSVMAPTVNLHLRFQRLIKTGFAVNPNSDDPSQTSTEALFSIK
jgi:hypothetical protein